MHFGKSLSEDSSLRQRGNLIFKSLHIFTLNIQLNMMSITNIINKKVAEEQYHEKAGEF